MTSRRLFVSLCVVLGLAFALIGASTRWGWSALAVQSGTLATAKAQNQGAIRQLTQLEQDKQAIATYSQLDTIARSVVPQDKNAAEAVREIIGLAAQSGMSRLSAVGLPASTLGTSAKTSTATSQLIPVKGSTGLFVLLINVSQADTEPVPYNQLIAFLSKLEQNRRTAQISSLDIKPDTKNPNLVSFNLKLNLYIKP